MLLMGMNDLTSYTNSSVLLFRIEILGYILDSKLPRQVLGLHEELARREYRVVSMVVRVARQSSSHGFGAGHA